MNSITRQLAAAGVISAAALFQPAFACDGVIDIGDSRQAVMEPRNPASSSGDGLGVYEDDLSAYHVPIRMRPGTSGDHRAGIIAAATSSLLNDPAALRSLFHRPELNRLDSLSAYHDDPGWRPQIPMLAAGRRGQ